MTSATLSPLAAAVALALTVGALLLAGGLAWRLAVWLRAPQSLPIPITPAPLTRAGAFLRLARETLLFESLFKADRGLWALGWTFHAALALTVLHHLRLFTAGWWPWTVWLAIHGRWWSSALLVSLAGLWLRRIVLARVRRVSAPSDHLLLALIAGIAVSGVVMRYLRPVNVVAVKRFARGVVHLDWQPLPAHGILVVHLVLVALLLGVLPFSKLLHGPGVWFSPTRYRPDDARRARGDADG